MKKRYILLLILFLTIGFASITINLYFHGDIILGKNTLINSVYISEVDYEASISNDEEEFTFTLSDANNYRIEYTVGNKELQYDALVNVECDGNTSTINYAEDKLVESQTKETSYITINKTDATSETITCRIVNVLLEKDEIATQKIYKLIFDPNTGNLGKESKNVMINEEYGWLPEPTKTDYNFLGWYTSASGGNLVTSETILTESQNVTIYAHWREECGYSVGHVWDFYYNGTNGSDGSIQELNVSCPGTYKLEVWGAQGGNNGGYGGYSVGEIDFDSVTKLYINVGGTGTNIAGGYNGGGNPATKGFSDAYGGGGATHIALTSGNLSSIGYNNRSKILIVGAGGGGTGGSSYSVSYNAPGANAGGYYGKVGSTGQTSLSSFKPGVGGNGANQSNGGNAGSCGNYNGSSCGTGCSGNSGIAGSFGTGGNGGNGANNTTACDGETAIYNGGRGGGGGGGFFGGAGGGGGSGSNQSGNSSTGGGGGGGSSYIANDLLYNKEMYCIGCNTSNTDSIKTISNNNSSADPEARSSKIGHGHARITLISLD